MRILLIEDDKKLCSSLIFQLEKEGYSIDSCNDGESGMMLIKQKAHDIILLDRMLPGLDGLSILEQTRRERIMTPILLITALGEIADRVTGLESGADDYIVKPFAFEELLARIRSVLRRPARLENAELLSFGDIQFNCRTKKLTGRQTTISLSKREGALLELFLKNPGQTLPRDLILTRVWGPYAEIEDGNLDNYIHFLRRRLKTVQSSLAITTIRGVGYSLMKGESYV